MREAGADWYDVGLGDLAIGRIGWVISARPCAEITGQVADALEESSAEDRRGGKETGGAGEDRGASQAAASRLCEHVGVGIRHRQRAAKRRGGIDEADIAAGSPVEDD